MNKVFKLLLLSFVIALPAFAQQGFVKVKGTEFTIDGKPYRYIGTNYWYGGLLATNGEAGKRRLKTELNFLKQHGVTNLRVMVGAEGLTDYKYRTPNEKVLEPEAGKFNENIMVGLDYLLNELAKRNMKAVLHFTNTWEWSGGIAQYLKWNGYGEQPYPKSLGGYYSWDKLRQYISQFYTCKPCMDELDNYLPQRKRCTIFPFCANGNPSTYFKFEMLVLWRQLRVVRRFIAGKGCYNVSTRS